MIVVSDTSVLYYAAQLGFDQILHQLYGIIIISPTVKKELEDSQAAFITGLLVHDWIEVHVPGDTDFISTLRSNLDSGEAEAIVLAIELNATHLLIDENRGRRVAKKAGLSVIGFLGILGSAKKAILIPAVKPWIERLTTETSFRHSPTIIQKILSLADEE